MTIGLPMDSIATWSLASPTKAHKHPLLLKPESRNVFVWEPNTHVVRPVVHLGQCLRRAAPPKAICVIIISQLILTMCEGSFPNSYHRMTYRGILSTSVLE